MGLSEEEENLHFFLFLVHCDMLSLPQLYNILYYICHVLPFNVMQFCAIMDIYYVVHNIRTNFFSRYKSYRYIHIFSYTHRKLLLLLLLSNRNIGKRFMYCLYFEVWNFGTRQIVIGFVEMKDTEIGICQSFLNLVIGLMFSFSKFGSFEFQSSEMGSSQHYTFDRLFSKEFVFLDYYKKDFIHCAFIMM